MTQEFKASDIYAESRWLECSCQKETRKTPPGRKKDTVDTGWEPLLSKTA